MPHSRTWHDILWPGLLRCLWCLFPGTSHTFLLASGCRRGSVAAAAGLSLFHWGERDAEDDLDRDGSRNEHLGMTWFMALVCFWTSENRSLIDSTASLKRPEGVIGAFKSTLRSASLRSLSLCWTTMNPMARQSPGQRALSPSASVAIVFVGIGNWGSRWSLRMAASCQIIKLFALTFGWGRGAHLRLAGCSGPYPVKVCL